VKSKLKQQSAQPEGHLRLKLAGQIIPLLAKDIADIWEQSREAERMIPVACCEIFPNLALGIIPVVRQIYF
jgi:hypothetical protein